jgi:hypothetical protein
MTTPPCRASMPSRCQAAPCACQNGCGRRGTLREHHRGHRRAPTVTRPGPIPSSCAAFVPAASRAWPRFPPRRSMVRRRSPVRVREKALNPRKAEVFVAWTDRIEHLLEREGAVVDQRRNLRKPSKQADAGTALAIAATHGVVGDRFWGQFRIATAASCCAASATNPADRRAELLSALAHVQVRTVPLGTAPARHHHVITTRQNDGAMRKSNRFVKRRPLA